MKNFYNDILNLTSTTKNKKAERAQVLNEIKTRALDGKTCAIFKNLPQSLIKELESAGFIVSTDRYDTDWLRVDWDKTFNTKEK